MAIPDYQALMRPLLELTREKTWRMTELAPVIASKLGLTEEERLRRLPSDRQTYLANRLHWAKYHLARAGLIDVVGPGVFRATARGDAFLAGHAGAITVSILKQIDAYAAADDTPAHPYPGQSAAIDQATPQERITAAQAEINSALATELLDRIYRSGPSFFETLIVQVLVAMGYGGTHENAAKAIGGSGDGGVDGVIDEDRLGLDQIYVQAKCYQADTVIGRPALQGFVGALAGKNAAKGVFVTTSSFAQTARDYIRSVPQRISLIDGRMLAALMIEHDVGVRTEETIVMQAIDEEFFDPS